MAIIDCFNKKKQYFKEQYYNQLNLFGKYKNTHEQPVRLSQLSMRLTFRINFKNKMICLFVLFLSKIKIEAISLFTGNMHV